METNEMEGVVEDVSEKPNKNGVLTYKIKIKDKTYSGFGKSPAKKGDTVHFEYTQNEQWLNIVKDSLEVVKDIEPPIEKTEYAIDLRKMEERKQTLIVRQTCLQRAVEIAIANKDLLNEKIEPIALENVITLARKLEKEYVFGD